MRREPVGFGAEGADMLLSSVPPRCCNLDHLTLHHWLRAVPGTGHRVHSERLVLNFE